MSRLFAVCALIAGMALLTVQSQTLSAQGRGRGPGRMEPGGQGRKAVRGEVPPEMGARTGAEAIDALRGDLGQKVRDRGQDPAQYAALMAADESLWIDDEGQMMFVDAIEHDDTPGPGDPPDAEPPAPTGPPPQPMSVLSNGMPIHHSKPGAPWTIYLDFDGENVRSSVWRISNRFTPGLTLDADFFAFNVEEQAIISRIWGRVAEDWAPFDVDVTTEHPGVISSTVLWSIIGTAPAGSGVLAQRWRRLTFCLCYVHFGLQTPTFTFWEPWGATDHSTIADVITQENGHMFGLLHDGIINPNCVRLLHRVRRRPWHRCDELGSRDGRPEPSQRHPMEPRRDTRARRTARNLASPQTFRYRMTSPSSPASWGSGPTTSATPRAPRCRCRCRRPATLRRLPTWTCSPCRAPTTFASS